MKVQSLQDNKKDLKIAKLKSQLHEMRQRAKDYGQMNERFNMLRSKVDILTQSNHDNHNNLEGNFIHVSD